MTNIKVWYTLPRVDEYGRVHARNCYFEKNTEDIHWDERVLTVGKMKFYTRKYHIENGDLPNDVDDDYSYVCHMPLVLKLWVDAQRWTYCPYCGARMEQSDE